MKFLFTIIFLTFASVGYAQQDQFVFPVEKKADVDEELRDLAWNRYTTDNFAILSIDDSMGKWLSDNIFKIRRACLNRWGFPEFKFQNECRIFVVPNKALLSKLFNITENKVEIRDNVSVIWAVVDEQKPEPLSSLLTEVCVKEFEKKFDTKLPFWFKRGVTLSNSSLNDVKSDISNLYSVLKKSSPIYTSDKIFTITEDRYTKAIDSNKVLFDNQALAMALMLRKEFGQAKLQGFLRLSPKNDPEQVLKMIYGFENYADFDKQYVRYMKDLSSDVVNNKTPDSYLKANSLK